MAHYIGLTDDPAKRKQEHGHPTDWQQIGPFMSEQVARDWEKQCVAQPGYLGNPGGGGWKYGYWYTVTARTIE